MTGADCVHRALLPQGEQKRRSASLSAGDGATTTGTEAHLNFEQALVPGPTAIARDSMNRGLVGMA